MNDLQTDQDMPLRETFRAAMVFDSAISLCAKPVDCWEHKLKNEKCKIENANLLTIGRICILHFTCEGSAFRCDLFNPRQRLASQVQMPAIYHDRI